MKLMNSLIISDINSNWFVHALMILIMLRISFTCADYCFIPVSALIVVFQVHSNTADPFGKVRAGDVEVAIRIGNPCHIMHAENDPFFLLLSAAIHIVDPNKTDQELTDYLRRGYNNPYTWIHLFLLLNF
jgi:hypothetical protein